VGLADATHLPLCREAVRLVAGVNPTLFALAAAVSPLAVAAALLRDERLVTVGLRGRLGYLLGIAALSRVNLVGTVALLVPVPLLLQRNKAGPRAQRPRPAQA
jgi:hypothetical protein